MHKSMTLLIISNIIASLVLFLAINKHFDREHEAYLEHQHQLAVASFNEQQYRAETLKHPELQVSGYDANQVKLMKIAYNVGSEYGIAEVMQGILLQETIAGRFGNRIGGVSEGLAVGKRYYGVTQMKISAVEDALTTYPIYIKKYFGNRNLPQIADEEIINKLMSNDEFAIRMASLYFSKYKKQANGTAEAIAMYNRGPAGAKQLANPATFFYVEGVQDHIKYNVKRFNQKYLAHINRYKGSEPQHVASI
jgi:hypothetical protein